MAEIPDVSTKECRRCDRVQPISEFHKDPNRTDGLHPYCRGCRTIYAKGYYAKNRERILIRTSARQAAHPEEWRERHLKNRFGITVDEFDALLEDQGGACAVCLSTDPKASNWHVDHDHDSGVVRGILCGPCNRGIGYLQDNAEIVEAAMSYLRRMTYAS